MALQKLYYVSCDACGRPAGSERDVSERSDGARQIAKRKKWAREAGCDICPACRAAGWRAAEVWPDGVVVRLVTRRLHCHTLCYEIRCPRCGWSAGETHYRDDAEPDSGELSSWGDFSAREGDTCPSCQDWGAPKTEAEAVEQDWEREL